MAFSSFGNPSTGTTGLGGAANVQVGPDLKDIQTEGLAFKALSGESKVQLLPTQWPLDSLPPPTASLLSVASHRGLVAAAGPDSIVIASTQSVRQAFDGTEQGDRNIKPFQPQLTIPMGMRVSQLAFSADESYLVLSAEAGGGLAVYDVQTLMQGSTHTAFELPTDGQSLRTLAPNPTPEKGELFAIVTANGKLMMANLKERKFVSGPNEQVLKDGVSCISWSAKGKQLVAGLGNGAAYQMTPEGEGKAEIPRPPGVNPADHVSSIIWLENHVFLMVHTPSTNSIDSAPESVFHVVTRQQTQQTTTFMFQKITDPAPPFGLNRSPPHHFILRLREYPPNLQDVLIVASTASGDVGIFTKSKVSLTSNKADDQVTGVFTLTEMSDDSKRASMPMSATLDDTSPIGLALDLSSKDKVWKPIIGDEIDESPYPLPALMILNNEGVLASWWFIYSDSIRQSSAYPGLIAGGASLQSTQTATATTTASTPLPAATSAFGGPAKPAFGASAFSTQPKTPAFGQASAPGAFGAPAGLGQKASVWGAPVSTTTTNSSPAFSSTPAFGAPAFGSTNTSSSSTPAFGAPAFGSTNTPSSSTPAFGAPAFGSTNTPSSSTPAFGAPAFGSISTPSFSLGNRQSVWGSSGGTTSQAAFGKVSGPGKPASPFGTPAANTGSVAPSSGGFANFAQTGGFAAAAATTNSGGSVFGAKSPSTPFATFGPSSPPPSSNVLGGAATKGDSKTSSSPFATSSFVLGSTFKKDPDVKDDVSTPSNESKSSFFGGAFGGALGEAAKAPTVAVSKEADMDSDEPPQQPSKTESTTPASAPVAPKNHFGATTTNKGGLFGIPPSSTPPISQPSTSLGFSFGKPPVEKPKASGFSLPNPNSETPSVPTTPIAKDTQPLPITSNTPISSIVKQEPRLEPASAINKIPEVPLPPDSTSKTSYAAGESSGSSVGDAPLPPDFVPKASVKPAESPLTPVPNKSVEPTIPAELVPPIDVSGGPEDEDDDSDFITEEEEDNGSEEGDAQASVEDSEEGSGEDVANDLSPVSEANQTPGFTPQSSFGGLKNRNPESSNLFTNIPRPLPASSGRSLFGELNGSSAHVLPPPNTRTSPRSPSPVRNAVPGRMQHPGRSTSAPHMVSQLLGPRTPSRLAASNSSTFSMTLEERQVEEKRQADIRARQEADETRALVDEDDENMQHELASEVTGTTDLVEFVAHSDYINTDSTESVPAQVETVYRDINSMIDTLGINARSLKAFIKGHTEQCKEEGRNRKDLENPDDWVLVEVENLSSLIESDLTRKLQDGRVKDVADKLETCNNLQKDLIRLRAKHEEIKKIIDARRNPDQSAAFRAQPLSAEQSAQQNDLRGSFREFQRLLSEAEEGLTLLKSKIISQATSTGSSNNSAGPTVEAVIRTIAKMTSMAEKRSGDIDVLEGQMRRLRFSSTTSAGSREGSPFATPQNNRTSLRNPGTSSTYGLFYTPDSIKDTQRRFQNSSMSSTSSFARGSPPRKKLSGYTTDEKTQLKAKLARKKDVTNRLKAALEKVGTNIRLMD